MLKLSVAGRDKKYLCQLSFKGHIERCRLLKKINYIKFHLSFDQG